MGFDSFTLTSHSLQIISGYGVDSLAIADFLGQTIDLDNRISLSTKRGLMSVLVEAIANAVEHSPLATKSNTSGKWWLGFLGDSTSDTVELFVIDSGKGIPREIARCGLSEGTSCSPTSSGGSEKFAGHRRGLGICQFRRFARAVPGSAVTIRSSWGAITYADEKLIDSKIHTRINGTVVQIVLDLCAAQQGRGA